MRNSIVQANMIILTTLNKSDEKSSPVNTVRDSFNFNDFFISFSQLIEPPCWPFYLRILLVGIELLEIFFY